MRQITYRMNLRLDHSTWFNIIDERTVTEEQMISREFFEALVSAVKIIGCEYRIEEIPNPVLIENTMGIKRF